jgi:hypothetical protein
MSWRPLDRVPDDIELAFHDAVRASILPVELHSAMGRDETGTLAITLADGRTAHVKFEATAQEPTNFGPRSALRYELQGRAVIGHDSFGLAARAIVDVKTRAFVAVACEVLWRKNGANGREAQR